ncbi:nuclear transport factor 2 family protein [Candidatus Solirubrobacter pratensis]|uniref:nuclear transport factor 2 family protein n=1 Tax=Candidatus Solirubrobacter pratensis TaxID=1298857 RepID=UPI0009DBF3BC|nr:nuclear transport factor 2 family protein [Candidatus Solirubrobacter pratensis]
MSGSWYTIRVAGGLGVIMLGAFPEFASHIDGSITTLTGELPDSAALYGALARLEALGLDLIDMHRLDNSGRARVDDAEAIAHARAIFEAFDAKDVSALWSLMSDDVRLRLGNAETVAGKSAFAEAVNGFFASVAGFRHDVIDVWRDGDTLIAELDVHYIRLDGREVSVPCCNVFRLRNGSVADYRTYIDVTPVYASAPPAQVGEPGA